MPLAEERGGPGDVRRREGGPAPHDEELPSGEPRIVRLRPDKPVDEIDTLETVRGIAEEVAGVGPPSAERDLS